MQNDSSESHSVVTDVNSLNSALATLGYSDSVYRLNHDHAMSGFPQHLSFVEAVNNLVCGQMANRDEIWNLNIQDPKQVMEGIPFPTVTPVSTLSSARNGTLDYQEKLLNFGRCVYPFDDSSNAVYSSVETMMNHGYENLPFDSSTKWDLNKFVTAESFGRVIGRNGVQPLNPTENSFANEWILSQNTAGTNSNCRGTSRFSNELSLSLASSQPSTVHGTSIQDQCSEQTSGSSSNLSLSFDSYKPLQPSPLLGSGLFQAMQEILAEIACYALVSYSTAGIDNGNKVSVLSSHCFFPSDKLEVEAKKKQMLALLQMIDEQYNRCLDEVHTVVSAFHAVTELDPNLHARFALPTISLMYKNLRERISSHVLAMGTNLDEGGEQQKEEKSFETSFIQKQWALQQLRKSDSQLWRPQRGLPERSVSVLRAWMFQNFLHPYPKDAEKHLLAIKSGLTRNQVSNWFINARVRLWKPMIEEMYAEMSRRKDRRNGEDQTDHVDFQRNPMHFENRRFATD